METLKKLPSCVTKKELMYMYMENGYTADVIRKGVNEIISNSRNIPLSAAKNVKMVRAKEFTLFVQEFDMPVGYTR